MSVLHVNVSEDVIVVCEYLRERSSWFSRGDVFSTRDICWIFKSSLESPENVKHKKITQDNIQNRSLGNITSLI